MIIPSVNQPAYQIIDLINGHGALRPQKPGNTDSDKGVN